MAIPDQITAEQYLGRARAYVSRNAVKNAEKERAIGAIDAARGAILNITLIDDRSDRRRRVEAKIRDGRDRSVQKILDSLEGTINALENSKFADSSDSMTDIYELRSALRTARSRSRAKGPE